MPNRIIKESICTSEQIDGLTMFEEIFFYRLIVNADDYGRCDARTSVLRARLFPLKETVGNEDVESALESLENAGLIARYSVDGRLYLFLPGWHRNQKVRSKRVKCPPPPGWVEGADGDEQICAGARKTVNGDEQTCAGAHKTVNGDEQICAGARKTVNGDEQICAGARKTVNGDEQICAGAQQVVSDCVPNPIQSESQSESQSQNESEPESGSIKKEKDRIYNSSWRYSPRARSATAQILVDDFHRAGLACTQLRDLFVVVEHALEMGIPPDEIRLAANSMRATAFAAHFMSMDADNARNLGPPNK